MSFESRKTMSIERKRTLLRDPLVLETVIERMLKDLIKQGRKSNPGIRQSSPVPALTD
ncbi:MAG: hypothetical protein P9L92_05410 [Candidatus Electryonea clarkiae]|nr:hypothetical protein [Candidatus Electryonea clarkiae]